MRSFRFTRLTKWVAHQGGLEGWRTGRRSLWCRIGRGVLRRKHVQHGTRCEQGGARTLGSPPRKRRIRIAGYAVRDGPPSTVRCGRDSTFGVSSDPGVRARQVGVVSSRNLSARTRGFFTALRPRYRDWCASTTLPGWTRTSSRGTGRSFSPRRRSRISVHRRFRRLGRSPVTLRTVISSVPTGPPARSAH